MRKMPKYIMQIIRQQPMIMFSWGFHSPRATENDLGLVFEVNGFIHQGKVRVKYNEGKDLFIVTLLDTTGSEVKSIDDIYFDKLIRVIDEAVEKASDYNQRITKEYNL